MAKVSQNITAMLKKLDTLKYAEIVEFCNAEKLCTACFREGVVSARAGHKHGKVNETSAAPREDRLVVRKGSELKRWAPELTNEVLSLIQKGGGMSQEFPMNVVSETVYPKVGDPRKLWRVRMVKSGKVFGPILGNAGGQTYIAGFKELVHSK